MAKEYPFKLDPFQSTSVACLVSKLVPEHRKPVSSVHMSQLTAGLHQELICYHRREGSLCLWQRTLQLAKQLLQSKCVGRAVGQCHSHKSTSMPFHKNLQPNCLHPCRYAIAMAFRDNQKVIYTSPFKVHANNKGCAALYPAQSVILRLQWEVDAAHCRH